MTRLAAVLILALFALAPPARAQDDYVSSDGDELTVIHGPLQPDVERRVRSFVLAVADNFGGFYPEAEFRNVRAVYFASGSIIICGEMNKRMGGGARSG